MITEITTRRVNPHRVNLVLTTNDVYADYTLTKIGFAYNYTYNRYLKDTPLYDTAFYDLPETLISRVFQEYEETDLISKWNAESMRKQVEEIQVLLHSTPALEQYVLEAKDLVHTIGFIKRMDMPIIKAILKDFGFDPENTILKDHQLQAMALYVTLGYSNNWGQMRTGKTPPTIIWAYMLYLRTLQGLPGEIDTAIIVCPNSIKHSWLHEIGKFTNPIVQSLSDVIEGTKVKKAALWEKASIFKIVNYESLRSDIRTVHETLQDKQYALILDESHNVKNQSKQTLAVQSLIRSDTNPPAYFTALSGTPVANKPQDIVRVLQMTAPSTLGRNYDDFASRYCYRDTYNSVFDFQEGALDEIHNQMARLSVRALRADVGMDLGKVMQPIELTMTKVQKETHDDLKKVLRTELLGWDGTATAIQISSFLAKLMKLQQVTAGFLYDSHHMVHWLEDKHNPKLKWLDQFIFEYLDDIGKIVIACKFIPMITKITERYSHLGSTCVYGAIKPEERIKRMERFANNPDCRIFVLNASTAEGMDLNPCQFMVFITKDFQPKTNWQCEDRITGFKAVGEATIMPLLCEHSIDQSLEAILEKKQEWFDKTMGDEGKTTPKVLSGLSITKEDLFSLVS